MSDERLARLADLLVNYSNEVQPGEWCLIQGEIVTTPLAREIYRAILEAGGYPSARMLDPEMNLIKMEYASDEQLDFASPILDFMVNEVEVLFNLFGSVNTRMMSNVDPERHSRTQKAHRQATETYFRRIANDELRFVISRFPTHANAQEAEMSLRDYEDFVFKACLLDEPDPVAAWNEVHDKQQRVVDWLAGKKVIQVEGPGIDLVMSIGGRPFVNSDGKKNMPSGEVFTSPVEDSVNGRIEFSYPTILGGREVNGVKLEFEDGRVVEASAEKGQDYLISQIDQDEGARVMGEFAIGTNYAIQQFTGDTLFDEKIGGTIHIALGQGIEEAGGTNKSIIHWDMVTDMKAGGRILVDDELIYEDGEFKI